jgi:hypothetical protein
MMKAFCIVGWIEPWGWVCNAFLEWMVYADKIWWPTGLPFYHMPETWFLLFPFWPWINLMAVWIAGCGRGGGLWNLSSPVQGRVGNLKTCHTPVLCSWLRFPSLSLQSGCYAQKLNWWTLHCCNEMHEGGYLWSTGLLSWHCWSLITTMALMKCMRVVSGKEEACWAHSGGVSSQEWLYIGPPFCRYHRAHYLSFPFHLLLFIGLSPNRLMYFWWKPHCNF